MIKVNIEQKRIAELELIIQSLVYIIRAWMKGPLAKAGIVWLEEPKVLIKAEEILNRKWMD